MSPLSRIEHLAALHASGALTDEEYARARGALPPPADATLSEAQNDSTAPTAPDDADTPVDPAELVALRARVAQLEREAAVAQVDRAWQDERNRLLLKVQEGWRSSRELFVPTKRMGVITGFAIVLVGILTLLTLNGSGSDNPRFFAVTAIIVGIWQGVRLYQQAEKYDAAQRDYEFRRAETLAGRTIHRD